MGKMHVKTGDTVIVIAGKEKGKKGKVIATYSKKDRVVVDGLNLVKRHTNRVRTILKAALSPRKQQSMFPT